MIEQLTEDDLPLVLDFRYRMMEECGMTPLLAEDWRELTHRIYAEGYRLGTIAHFGWREGGRIVATAGVMIRDDFPANTLKPRRYGWIMDVFVLPENRRGGHARRLTEATLAWLRGKGVVFARLVASEQAKRAGLYEKLGFTFSNEMRLRLDPAAG
ncbi:MAG: GNAT family N-acetyltransferase [Opitutaceae bacterium]|nr:GNAT family N-acetyltransferase [Opitutaceae bacterium]